MDAGPPKPQTAATAVASLILGILGFLTFAFTSLPAIICGHVARSRIRESGGQLGGNRMAISGLVLGYLSGIAALAIVASIAWFLVPPSDESGIVSQGKVDKFAARAGLVIPATATATEYRWVFARDGQEYLKLEMPAADLPEFLDKSGLADELRNTTSTRGFNSTFGELLPAHPKKFRDGQKSLPNAEFLNVLVDEDSPATVVVYLCRFGT